MNKEFVTYEQALALKELGFDEPCFAYYNIDPQLKTPAFNMVKPFKHEWCLSAPLYQQAFRFFREKHNLWCWIEKFDEKETYIYQIPAANLIKVQGYYKTHEEAELACLKQLIKIVKEK